MSPISRDDGGEGNVADIKILGDRVERVVRGEECIGISIKFKLVGDNTALLPRRHLLRIRLLD